MAQVIGKDPMNMKLFLAATLAVTSLSLYAAAPEKAEWKLVWSDEFNTPGRPDPKKWDYEVGFVRNEEAQYYTRDRRENARVEGGMLVLEGRKEAFPNPEYKPGAKDWQHSREKSTHTSASLTTRGKASWTYGRLEIRAKLPSGKGVWPAFWTLGDDKANTGWPGCGEIDVMEFLGKEPDRAYGTVHFQKDGKHQSNGGKTDLKGLSSGFHVYAVEWFPDRIDFYLDKKKYHTFHLDQAGNGAENSFRKPHYIILNLALGGGWGGPIDDGRLPQKFMVDYVRVYEWTGAKPPPEEKPASATAGKEKKK